MSRVLERIPAKVTRIEEQIYQCNQCGCGNAKDMTEGPCPRPSCSGHRLVRIVERFDRTPGYVIVKCDCGEEVMCHGFTSTCDNCEADYNWAGQRLAPREQWGEETGETYADITGPGDPFDA